MFHRTKRNSGFTLVELLVVIGIIALLAAILLPVLARATAQAKSTRCKNKLNQLYKGLRMYLNNFDEYIPAALHIGDTPGADLGGYHYHRFAVHEYADQSFTHVVRTEDTTAGRDTEWKFNTNRIFWQCPAQGYTTEYFGPAIAFRIPGGVDSPAVSGGTFDRQAQYNTLVSNMSSTERPLLTDVDASYATDVFAADEAKSSAHHGDLTSGYQIHTDTAAGDRGIFIGAGESLRTETDYGTERFDFRHNGACNVLYLDSHVVALRETDGAQLERVHDRWNSLRVTND
jgi:prepilin-type N-terminal cleavage/methylation domain-containing protein/prepilin-type processing-associated H-X9-DG protein